ncbi:titin-like [Scaptodrosophila lebanonensis]|uniref:Titin-like n=1 Tax=Drosophila lebanonensis TaxID=7225 RepID=A0A6J2THE4_DROLE|nr:titin-like [Scaptodrosophila lebanonensis]
MVSVLIRRFALYRRTPQCLGLICSTYGPQPHKQPLIFPQIIIHQRRQKHDDKEKKRMRLRHLKAIEIRGGNPLEKKCCPSLKKDPGVPLENAVAKDGPDTSALKSSSIADEAPTELQNCSSETNTSSSTVNTIIAESNDQPHLEVKLIDISGESVEGSNSVQPLIIAESDTSTNESSDCSDSEAKFEGQQESASEAKSNTAKVEADYTHKTKDPKEPIVGDVIDISAPEISLKVQVVIPSDLCTAMKEGEHPNLVTVAAHVNQFGPTNDGSSRLPPVEPVPPAAPLPEAKPTVEPIKTAQNAVPNKQLSPDPKPPGIERMSEAPPKAPYVAKPTAKTTKTEPTVKHSKSDQPHRVPGSLKDSRVPVKAPLESKPTAETIKTEPTTTRPAGEQRTVHTPDSAPRENPATQTVETAPGSQIPERSSDITPRAPVETKETAKTRNTGPTATPEEAASKPDSQAPSSAGGTERTPDPQVPSNEISADRASDPQAPNNEISAERPPDTQAPSKVSGERAPDPQAPSNERSAEPAPVNPAPVTEAPLNTSKTNPLVVENNEANASISIQPLPDSEIMSESQALQEADAALAAELAESQEPALQNSPEDISKSKRAQENLTESNAEMEIPKDREESRKKSGNEDIYKTNDARQNLKEPTAQMNNLEKESNEKSPNENKSETAEFRLKKSDRNTNEDFEKSAESSSRIKISQFIEKKQEPRQPENSFGAFLSKISQSYFERNPIEAGKEKQKKPKEAEKTEKLNMKPQNIGTEESMKFRKQIPPFRPDNKTSGSSDALAKVEKLKKNTTDKGPKAEMNSKFFTPDTVSIGEQKVSGHISDCNNIYMDDATSTKLTQLPPQQKSASADILLPTSKIAPPMESKYVETTQVTTTKVRDDYLAARKLVDPQPALNVSANQAERNAEESDRNEEKSIHEIQSTVRFEESIKEWIQNRRREEEMQVHDQNYDRKENRRVKVKVALFEDIKDIKKVEESDDEVKSKPDEVLETESKPNQMQMGRVSTGAQLEEGELGMSVVLKDTEDQTTSKPKISLAQFLYDKLMNMGGRSRARKTKTESQVDDTKRGMATFAGVAWSGVNQKVLASARSRQHSNIQVRQERIRKRYRRGQRNIQQIQHAGTLAPKYHNKRQAHKIATASIPESESNRITESAEAPSQNQLKERVVVVIRPAVLSETVQNLEQLTHFPKQVEESKDIVILGGTTALPKRSAYLFTSKDNEKDSTAIRGGSATCKAKSKSVRKQKTKEPEIEILGGSECVTKLKEEEDEDDCKRNFSSVLTGFARMLWYYLFPDAAPRANKSK